MKHTPGPWKFEREETKRYDEQTGEARLVSYNWIKAAKTHKYASFPFPQTICSLMSGSCTLEEEKANGALIAAAPDMKSALETLLFGLTDDVTNNNGKIDFDGLIMTVKEALSKAKGE